MLQRALRKSSSSASFSSCLSACTGSPTEGAASPSLATGRCRRFRRSAEAPSFKVLLKDLPSKASVSSTSKTPPAGICSGVDAAHRSNVKSDAPLDCMLPHSPALSTHFFSSSNNALKKSALTCPSPTTRRGANSSLRRAQARVETALAEGSCCGDIQAYIDVFIYVYICGFREQCEL